MEASLPRGCELADERVVAPLWRLFGLIPQGRRRSRLRPASELPRRQRSVASVIEPGVVTFSNIRGDFVTAGRELRARKSPNPDSACFHAQQCVEKLMKAVLNGRKMLALRTHNLVILHRHIQQVAPDWLWDEAELDWLSRAAVGYRYPGLSATSATREHAKTALAICRRLRDRLIGLLA